MKRSKQSHCRDRVAPLVGGLGSEDPQRGARDEMALEIEGVVDGRMHAEKALCGARRLEPLHFALASSHRLMRVLRSIVLSEPLLVEAAQP